MPGLMVHRHLIFLRKSAVDVENSQVTEMVGSRVSGSSVP